MWCCFGDGYKFHVLGFDFLGLGLILLFLIMFLIFYLVKINKLIFLIYMLMCHGDVPFFIIF